MIPSAITSAMPLSSLRRIHEPTAQAPALPASKADSGREIPGTETLSRAGYRVRLTQLGEVAACGVDYRSLARATGRSAEASTEDLAGVPVAAWRRESLSAAG